MIKARLSLTATARGSSPTGISLNTERVVASISVSESESGFTTQSILPSGDKASMWLDVDGRLVGVEFAEIFEKWETQRLIAPSIKSIINCAKPRIFSPVMNELKLCPVILYIHKFDLDMEIWVSGFGTISTIEIPMQNTIIQLPESGIIGRLIIGIYY